eukprot:Awhi_evm1s13270
MNDDQVIYLQSSLCILTGLYGILRPLDEVKPYRLDMGTKIQCGPHKNLYEFWKAHDLTEKALEMASDNGCSGKGDILLNCASVEYSKAINLKEFEKR